MSEEQESFSLVKVETGIARFKWKPFNVKFQIETSRTETFGQRFRLDLFDFEILGEVFCFDFVSFSRLLDFIELKIGFRLKSDFREKEFRFLNRESLDQVSNSKALFVLSLC